jgi:hypothetical protein
MDKVCSCLTRWVLPRQVSEVIKPTQEMAENYSDENQMNFCIPPQDQATSICLEIPHHQFFKKLCLGFVLRVPYTRILYRTPISNSLFQKVEAGHMWMHHSCRGTLISASTPGSPSLRGKDMSSLPFPLGLLSSRGSLGCQGLAF